MAAIKDHAIVLRRLDYSETSQVLALLTREHGPQRVIAKGIKRGARKKFATGIDLLERGEVAYISHFQREAGLATLTEWRQTDLYLGLRQRLDRWYAAQYAAEVTAGMTEEADPQPELFDALARLLSGLAAGEQPLPGLVAYQSVLLDCAGLWPDLTRCVVCDRPAPPGRAGYYSASQGGLICRDCEPPLPEKRKVSAAVLSGLRETMLDGETLRGAFDLLDYTIGCTLGHRTNLGRLILYPAMQEAEGNSPREFG